MSYGVVCLPRLLFPAIWTPLKTKQFTADCLTASEFLCTTKQLGKSSKILSKAYSPSLSSLELLCITYKDTPITHAHTSHGIINYAVILSTKQSFAMLWSALLGFWLHSCNHYFVQVLCLQQLATCRKYNSYYVNGCIPPRHLHLWCFISVLLLELVSL